MSLFVTVVIVLLLTDLPPSHNSALGAFKVESHARIGTNAWLNQKILVLIAIPL